jgi:hypothetical protein
MTHTPAHPPTAQAVVRLCCAHCRYEFDGIADFSRCPECGKPAHALESAAPARPTCIRCGYDLAGLPPETHCSECGTLVARSLHGNLLRYASPEYLLTLSRGARMVYSGIVGLCLSVFLAYPLFFLSWRIDLLAQCVIPSLPDDVLAPGIVITVALGLVALIFVGWVLLAAPDPAFVGRDPAARSRRVMRIGAILALGCGVTLLILHFAPPLALMLPSQIMTIRTAGWFMLLLAVSAQFLASTIYLGYLAGRIPERRLRTRLRDLRIVFIVVVVGVVIMFVAAAGFALFGGPLVLIPGLAVVVLGGFVVVRYAGAIELLRKRCMESVATARALEAAVALSHTLPPQHPSA